MSTTAGQAGVALVEAKDYAAALPKLNTALAGSSSPAWLLARSKCHIAQASYELALRDAEAAYLSAASRGLPPPHDRRPVPPCRRPLPASGRLADADACAILSRNLAEGISLRDAANLVPSPGTAWRPSRAAHLAEIKHVTARTDKAAMMEKKFGAIWNTAAALRAQVLAALERVPDGDDKARLTVALVPVERKQDEAEEDQLVREAGVPKDAFRAEFTEDLVRLSHIPGHEPWYEIPLYGQIDPAQCKSTVTPNKVELTLKKREPVKWGTLRRAADAPAAAPAKVAAAPAPAAAAPSSSRTGAKNWDKVLADEDDTEKESVNDFFKTLYKGATDEQKRAMMKSFTESNGTSLSTNWDDVKTGKVETVPPEGVNVKKWEA
ncbi:SGT1 protein [Verticillium dahliae VdLs.17]|uniref:SGT1 protein n=1 Tax=Verticillium dahliae (strain VdLs.17 / ATCC MYA-4575 / FGSC 10137) TaxID=498257 RepID=G2XGS9_VERDV|nr:SGT1 protein [Verticillium dahliae VdLs.17]EGY19027.1 SGT1 protein [Verticillium dahliae VdLs.17]